MGNCWSPATRRACCGSGAYAPVINEPTYEYLEPVHYEEVAPLHQAHSAASTLRLVESVDEIRRLLAPIADVSERMRRLELSLHPLLVYRPEEHYVDMRNGPWPVPAAPPTHTGSVWLEWLQERTDYGEPW